MTRDELAQEIRRRTPTHADELIDHLDGCLQDERERIAQDIETQAPVQLDASSGYQALRAGMIRAAAIVRGAES